MPVYAAAAGGGVVVDVDGNSLIDLGSGIAVTTIGNADPAVAAAVADQVSRFTHTCFMITGYEAYVEVAERLNRLTPGDHDKRTALFNSGAEAVENAIKIAQGRDQEAGGRGVRPRVPRSYQPDHEPDREVHALQERFRSSSPARSTARRCRTRTATDCPVRTPRRPRCCRFEKQVGADNLAAIIIEPIQGEGGFIVPAPGFLAEQTLVHGQRRRLHRRRDPDRLRPDRRDVRLRARRCGARPDHPSRRASPAVCRSPRSPVGPRSWTPPHVGGLGGTYGGNPVACAAAIAALEAFEHGGLIERAQQIESDRRRAADRGEGGRSPDR